MNRFTLSIVLLAALSCRRKVEEENLPPDVAIAVPSDGSQFAPGAEVAFAGSVSDDRDAPETLAVVWTSDLDGELFAGASDGSGLTTLSTSDLSPGDHTIALSATDSDGASGTASITLTIASAGSPPTIVVVAPDGEHGRADEPFTFSAEVADVEDPADTLLVEFFADVDPLCTPTVDTDGFAACDATLAAGTYALVYTVTDSDGGSASATATFVVDDPAALDDDGDGLSEADGDCDDADDAIHPGAAEVPDGKDQDCDGQIDDGTDDVDDDGDGFSELQGDCDDADVGAYPGAAEIPDGTDQDCDGDIDDGTARFDTDGDCFCADATTCSGSSDPACTTVTPADCDDADAAVSPGATEAPADGVDGDCDGTEDCFADTDDDGHGSATIVASSDLACAASGLSTRSDDCADTDATVFPAAPETAGDAVDQDCDGKLTCYVDGDGDTFGSGTTNVIAATCAGSGVAATPGDCDDTAATTFPGAPEITSDSVDQDCDTKEKCYQDGDNDTFGTSSLVDSADLDCADPGEASVATDCDDTLGSVHPGATEVTGDEIDQSCDGKEVCYTNTDNDAFGTASIATSTDADCRDAGEATQAGDCDDAVPSVFPGAIESTADGVDQDCDTKEKCYKDGDNDTYGISTLVDSADLDCIDSGEAKVATDCDDAVGTINPGATEVTGDQIDQTCDGKEVCYVNTDGDGFGTGSTTTSNDADCADAGEGTKAGDCNDGAATVYPGAAEITSDGIDQDCDTKEKCYKDGDNDTFGISTLVDSVDLDCIDTGESRFSTDCNDGATTVYPGATEVTGDEIDQSCDGKEVCYVNGDGDPYGVSGTVTSNDTDCKDAGEATKSGDCDDAQATVYPTAPILSCDGRDNDCNVATVEGGTAKFSYTGADQTFTVPTGCTAVSTTLWGAGGGGGNYGRVGGGGGYVSGTLSVVSAESLRVVVGRGGRVDGGAAYGGGGAAAAPSGGGGGYSGVFRNTTPLAIAGAGGGGATEWENDRGSDGGAGGGTTGGGSGGYPGTTAGGGSQTAGGAGGGGSVFSGASGGSLQGANAASQTNYTPGAGGGGYYGGGAGGAQCCYATAGGGGGSSYVGGLTGVTNTQASGRTPPQITNPLYPGSSVGYGGTGSGAGNPGYVVFSWGQ